MHALPPKFQEALVSRFECEIRARPNRPRITRLGFDALSLFVRSTRPAVSSASLHGSDGRVARLPLPPAYDDGGPSIARTFEDGRMLPGLAANGAWQIAALREPPRRH